MLLEWIQDFNNLTNLIVILIPSAIALQIFGRISIKKKYVTKKRYYKFRIPNKKTKYQYQCDPLVNQTYEESGLKNYFDFFGLHENASRKEIKTARNRMILSWHPDKNKSSTSNQMIQKINETYSTLKIAGKC